MNITCEKESKKTILCGGNSMKTNEVLREFIRNNLVTDEVEDFTDDVNVFERGFVNSLFAMKLLSFIEGTFNIDIDTEDIDIVNFSSVENMVKLIEKNK
jgi:acyl carrier protein